MNRQDSHDPNPYRSPAPGDVEPPSGDFRAEAAEASVALMEDSGQADPLEVGVSLCLPTGHPLSLPERLRRSVNSWLVAGSVLLVVAMGIGMFHEDLRYEWGNRLWLAVAVLCGVGGCYGIMLSFKRVGVPPRKYLGRRRDGLRALPGVSRVFSVDIEDASTFTKQTKAPKDLGFLGLDPVNRRIVIEGVVHRYVIRAEDVICIESVRFRDTVGTEVAYRIGDRAELTITLSNPYDWSGVLYVLTRIVRNPLLKKIKQTLGPISTAE
jgi:hypothetical protein